jgi:hypothetical protein
MLHPKRTQAAANRRAVILMVVLVLLTLFALLGISFVLYADAQFKASQIARDAETPSTADVPADELLSFFLSQLIYDVKDDQNGVFSAMRGHSLARSVYGYHYDDDGSVADNSTPWNGIGRLHTGTASGQCKPMNPWGLDDYLLVNYTYQSADNFLRDPERIGPAGTTNWRTDPTKPRGPFIGGFNVPYTYPDLRNMFLGAVRASDGAVLTQSFHRPWLFGSFQQTNGNWTTPQGKYALLRPRPQENSGFPYPEDEGGDVKNLQGSPGYFDGTKYYNNDSVWMDLNYPVITTPDGRKFKPLFAILVLDLDNRINLNVIGNVRGKANNKLTHRSNQGWGPWEVNPSAVLDATDAQGKVTEYTQMFMGSNQPTMTGRYGPDGQPSKANSSANLTIAPHFYASVDLDGANDDGSPTQPLQPLGQVNQTNNIQSCFPLFPPGFGNGSPTELLNHPSLSNVFFPAGDDRLLGIGNMEWLLRYGDSDSLALSSDLMRLLPQNLNNPADVATARRRRELTLLSMDIDRPGVTPWYWNSNTTSDYQYTPPNGNAPPVPPYGPQITFPTLASPPTTPPNGEFAADWRGLSAALGRIDLNRPLPPYPTPDATTAQIKNTDYGQFYAAQRARQNFAADIFTILRQVTGAGDPTSATGAQKDALRWLGQLAVNIVDLIDSDDYITPFNWNPNNPSPAPDDWVYGTELPRVLLNEALLSYKDPGGGQPKLANVWVELYNPLNADPSLADNGAARLGGTAGASDGCYQLSICNQGVATNLQQPSNTKGDVPSSMIIQTVSSFAPSSYPKAPPYPYPVDPSSLNPNPDPRMLLPSNGATSGTDKGNKGYYLLGPQAIGTANPTLTSNRMTYPMGTVQQPTLVLRRLACPYLLNNENLGDTTKPYNPYVTVDYFEDVPVGQDTSNPPSGGRRQPFAAAKALGYQPQQSGTTQHTFFKINIGVPGNFDWLVHLDRPLLSAAELLHVSGFKPHELTQQFQSRVSGQVRHFTHRVPWFDEDRADPNTPLGTTNSHRLYRFFEFVRTRSLASGLSQPPVTTTSKPINVPNSALPNGVNRTVQPAAMAGVNPSGVPWAIQQGSTLIIDSGANQENVVVTQATATNFTANFLRSHAAGATVALTILGDRTPGRINLNTVWDPEILSALADAQNSNNFGSTDVQQIFQQLISLRSAGTNGLPSANDRPYWSLAAGAYPSTDVQFPPPVTTYPWSGVERTLLRADQDVSSGNPRKNRLLQVPYNDAAQNLNTRSPYIRYELLNKLFNNCTTRSNVFAVWVTVGFFQVVDDTTQPVKLGAELGRSDNRNVRHRMFAIVDRSNVALPSILTTLQAPINPGGRPHTVPVGELSRTITLPSPTPSPSWSWSIDPGTTLQVGQAGNEEQVVVLATDSTANPPTITAVFHRSHSAGAPLTLAGATVPLQIKSAGLEVPIPGNPGPQPHFDLQSNSAVVPYYSVIE